MCRRLDHRDDGSGVRADLKRATFERCKPHGALIKTYRLSRKTILNIVGVVKLVLGRTVWMAWELDLGRPKWTRQPYFTQEQLRQIIDAAPERYRVLFALLAVTGLRIGEAAGLHLEDLNLDSGVIYVRRSVWNGQELEPKTENAVREIDIDPVLGAMLRDDIGSSHRIRLFEARNGSPLSLRKNGTRADLQKLWIRHSSFRTTDRYARTDQELEYRHREASRAGLDLIVGPNLTNWTQSASAGDESGKPLA